MSINDTVVADRDSYPVGRSVLQQYNLLQRDIAYFTRNRIASSTIALQPGCATATVTTQIKTVAAAIFELSNSIVPLVSLTATDPLWTVAIIAAGDANTLAIGSVRRWQLCWDGTSGTTVCTVRPSNDQIIASFATSTLALAACRWPNLPPAGTAIVGVASIVNITNVFTPGTTLLGAAGVTTTYRDGPDNNCYTSSLLTP